jgi:hypothetical protein
MKLENLFESPILATVKGFKNPKQQGGNSLITFNGKDWAFTGKTGVTNFSKKDAFEYRYDFAKGSYDIIWVTIDGEIYKD